MSESYEERQKRINRERQQRFRLKNKEKLAEERKKEREIIRQYKEQHQPEPIPAPAPPAPQPQQVIVPHPDRRRKIKVKRIIFTEEVILQMIKDYPMENEKTRSGYISAVKNIFRITECPDFGKCLKNFEKIKGEIENAKQLKDPTKPYSLNSKKQFIQNIVWIVDKLNVPLDNETKNKYKEYFDIYKQKSNDSREEQQSNKTAGEGAMPSVDVVLKTVEDKFGEDSKQFLITSFYKNAPMRDDFSSLIIIPSIRKNEDSKTNYVIVPRKDKEKCTLVIQKYKTDKLYGILKFKLDSKTSTLLRNYIKKHKVEYDGRLFPEYKKDSMSSYISSFMKKCGYTGEGGINYMRHVIFTEDVRKHENETGKKLSPEEIVRLSRRAGHSVVAHYNYVRQLIE